MQIYCCSAVRNRVMGGWEGWVVLFDLMRRDDSCNPGRKDSDGPGDVSRIRDREVVPECSAGCAVGAWCVFWCILEH